MLWAWAWTCMPDSEAQAAVAAATSVAKDMFKARDTDMDMDMDTGMDKGVQLLSVGRSLAVTRPRSLVVAETRAPQVSLQLMMSLLLSLLLLLTVAAGRALLVPDRACNRWASSQPHLQGLEQPPMFWTLNQEPHRHYLLLCRQSMTIERQSGAPRLSRCARAAA